MVSTVYKIWAALCYWKIIKTALYHLVVPRTACLVMSYSLHITQVALQYFTVQLCHNGNAVITRSWFRASTWRYLFL